MRRTIAWAGRHWGFPGNVHFWWTVGIPAVPALVTGAVAFVREAPLWQIAALVLVVYLVALGITAWAGPRKPFRWRARCRKLREPVLRQSSGLFQLAQERDETAPQGAPIQAGDGLLDTIKATFRASETWERAHEKTLHDEETWTQYRQKYEGNLRALLEDLEQRGCIDSEERRAIDGEFYVFWRSPTDRIKRVAARLDAIGKRL